MIVFSFHAIIIVIQDKNDQSNKSKTPQYCYVITLYQFDFCTNVVLKDLNADEEVKLIFAAKI